MDYWRFKKYRPKAFLPDQKATCRHCGEPCHFIFDDAQKAYRTRGCWAHDGITLETYDDQKHTPAPKEFCDMLVTSDDYDYCGRPVKYEDVRAENYACGHHMRKWNEEANDRRRREEATARQAEREALEAFETEQYGQAAQWIRDNGFGQLIGEYEPKPHYSNLKRYASVDVFRLKEFLEGVVEKLSFSNVWTVDEDIILKAGDTLDVTKKIIGMSNSEERSKTKFLGSP